MQALLSGSTSDIHMAPSESDIQIHWVIGQDASVWIYHDRPFAKTLSWLEYDLRTSRLDFIMEDGDIRNFGIAIDRQFGAHLQNTSLVPVVLRAGQTVIDGDNYPLIIHQS